MVLSSSCPNQPAHHSSITATTLSVKQNLESLDPSAEAKIPTVAAKKFIKYEKQNIQQEIPLDWMWQRWIKIQTKDAGNSRRAEKYTTKKTLELQTKSHEVN